MLGDSHISSEVHDLTLSPAEILSDARLNEGHLQLAACLEQLRRSEGDGWFHAALKVFGFTLRIVSAGVTEDEVDGTRRKEGIHLRSRN